MVLFVCYYYYYYDIIMIMAVTVGNGGFHCFLGAVC